VSKRPEPITSPFRLAEKEISAPETRQPAAAPKSPIALVQETIDSGAPFLFLEEVCAYLRVSDTTIWRQERAGKFPRRVHLSPKRVAWRTPDVVAFAAGTWKGDKREAA